jgi:hypothetical protein
MFLVPPLSRSLMELLDRIRDVVMSVDEDMIRRLHSAGTCVASLVEATWSTY